MSNGAKISFWQLSIWGQTDSKKQIRIWKIDSSLSESTKKLDFSKMSIGFTEW